MSLLDTPKPPAAPSGARVVRHLHDDNLPAARPAKVQKPWSGRKSGRRLSVDKVLEIRALAARGARLREFVDRRFPSRKGGNARRAQRKKYLMAIERNYSNKAIARKFGVLRVAIWNVVHYYSYREIE